LDSLLALGISFTNEFEDMEAFRYLHDWLKYHPDYSALSNVQDGQKLDFNEINNSFLAALQQKPGDAQVLLALGVL